MAARAVRPWVAAALALTGAAPAPRQGECPESIHAEGRLDLDRHPRLYDIRVEGTSLVPEQTDCLSAAFAHDRLYRRALRLDGRRMAVTATAVDYFAWAAADPVSATLSSLQNECGNRVVLVIHGIAPAR